MVREERGSRGPEGGEGIGREKERRSGGLLGGGGGGGEKMADSQLTHILIVPSSDPDTHFSMKVFHLTYRIICIE